MTILSVGKAVGKHVVKCIASGNEIGTALWEGNLEIPNKTTSALFDAAILVLCIYPKDTPQIIQNYIHVQGHSFWHYL